MVEAHIVQGNDLLCLTEPTDRLARGHQDFLVVVSRVSKDLDYIQVGEVADDLARLVGLQGDSQSRFVVHELNSAIYPVVQISRRLLRIGRGVIAREVLFAEIAEAAKAALAVHDLEKTLLSFNNPKTDGILKALVLDGVGQVLHLGFFYSLGLRLTLLVREPSGIAVDKFPILHTQPRLRKLDISPLHPEQIAVKMTNFIPEDGQDFICRGHRFLRA